MARVSEVNPYDTDPIVFDQDQSTRTFQYNFANNQVSGIAIPASSYDSPQKLLKLTGTGIERGELEFYFQKYTLGACNSGTPADCPGDKSEGIVSRDDFCRRKSDVASVCVEKTTEQGTTCRTELETEISKIALIDEYDVTITGCQKTCNGTRGVQYDVVFYAPEDKTLDSRRNRLTAALTAKTVPGFTVLSFEGGASSNMISLALMLVALLVVFLLR